MRLLPDREVAGPLEPTIARDRDEPAGGGANGRDPDGLPKLIRAFYASPWFDAPTPSSEAGGELGDVEGRTFALDLVYRDREAKP